MNWLQQLNRASGEDAAQMLSGVYEHSDWVGQRALARRPFASMAALQYALAETLAAASRDEQLQLMCAHPELSGKAAVGELTEDSSAEQRSAGLSHCSIEEFSQLMAGNARYRERFGFPFILAVKGPQGVGLSRSDIIRQLMLRLERSPEVEWQENIHQIHRIAQMRLNQRCGQEPLVGHLLWDQHQRLAVHSDRDDALSLSYLSSAHRRCAEDIAQLMREAGFDEVALDAVGNVVGRYHGAEPEAPILLTGSHYDTVNDAGYYDGRVGILLPIQVVSQLKALQRRLAVAVEVVAFAEEEGQRYRAPFIGSSPLAGRFNSQWLQLTDSQGISLEQAMKEAGLDPQQIPSLARDPKRYVGFVEVHIEQGPVLFGRHLPLGIVTSINAQKRFSVQAQGLACHAGTTPMDQRQDALCAVAELVLAIEQAALACPPAVATVGRCEVQAGSINVVPESVSLSIDVRAPSNAERDQVVELIAQAMRDISHKRQVRLSWEQVSAADAAPSDDKLRQLWRDSVAAVGLPLFELPSGAGHDAMQLHACMPQAMLFVRGENRGISHNRLEQTTSDDLQLAFEALWNLVLAL